jgi:hypothetical protein
LSQGIADTADERRDQFQHKSFCEFDRSMLRAGAARRLSGATTGQQPGVGILCTVLCCLPLGIVSIVYASKVSGLWAQGRYAEAQEASANA